MVRELREEIGMVSHSALQRACDLEEEIDFKRDLTSLLIVRDVEYRATEMVLAAISCEVEDNLEAKIDELPPDLSPRTAKWIKAVLPHP